MSGASSGAGGCAVRDAADSITGSASAIACVIRLLRTARVWSQQRLARATRARGQRIDLPTFIPPCRDRRRSAAVGRRDAPATAAQAPRLRQGYGGQAEVLYNGITLGSPWPPRWQYPNEHPVLAPYLADPPAVVPIDVGRQLFVDDFLIEETTLTRTCHKAEYHPGNPILRPETTWEIRDDAAERNKRPLNPAAMVFSDGVFFDPPDRTVQDVVHGRLRRGDLPGHVGRRHRVATAGVRRRARHQHRQHRHIAIRARSGSISSRAIRARATRCRLGTITALVLYVSPDGIHWTEIGETGAAGDRSTFFYNPFRRVWVFSMRANQYAVVDQRALPPLLGSRPISRPRATGTAASRWRG